MRRIAAWGVLPLVLAALAPLPAAAAATTSRSPTGTIWVTDRSGDRLGVYDLGSRKLVGMPSTEGVQDTTSADEPNDVAIALGKVYATNEASGTISVLDARTQQLLTRLPAGPKPHHAATNPRGDLVVYGVYGTNEVGFVDARTDTVRRVTASTRTGTVLSHSASFSADGRTVYVTNEVKSGDTQLTGTVSVVDVRTGAIGCELDVGIRPSEAVAARRGRFGYVSVRNDNAVKEIDFAHCRLTGRAVNLGEQVDTLWLTADGTRMSVGLRGPAPKLAARVAMVDVKTFRQSHVRYWTIPGGTLTGHQYTTPDGRYTFAAFEGAGVEGVGAGVAVIDHRANTVETLPALGGRPHGIAFTRAPGC